MSWSKGGGWLSDGGWSSVGAALASTTTWNPADKATAITLSNGNLTAAQTASGGSFESLRAIASHLGGKFYHEIHLDTAAGANLILGIADATETMNGNFVGQTLDSLGYDKSGAILVNSATVATIQASVQGNTVCIATDLTNSNIWFRTNAGNWNNSGTANPATNTGGISLGGLSSVAVFPAATTLALSDQVTANFGATGYAQSAPSGFGNW
jgi:hypothetical protein